MDNDISMDESEQSEVSTPSQQYNGKPFTALQSRDLVGNCFETLEAAQVFFYAYAHDVGFSVRKNIARRDKKGNISSRQWFCSCEGFKTVDAEKSAKRVRNPKKETRTGCKVAFLVNYRENLKKYLVTKFDTDHNHPTVMPSLRHHVRSARNVRDSDVAQVIVLHNASIQTCHAYEYMVDKAGGYVNVGFRIKDLYNKLDKSRREIMLDGDTEAALSYLNGIGQREENFYCKFSVDEENKLCNLFWRDTRSLIDYESFGDVLLFDSTYKTNCYGKPLLLFVGSSNHLTSVVFGCALLMDETTETYVWALETFISSMNGKKPIAVLTDSASSMLQAIEIVLPGCPHRLCSWHIAKNVNDNIKNKKMKERFTKIMWESATTEEFERSWADMMKEFPPKKTGWFDMMYAKRKKWVEVYCKGMFFARMRSTQRCEGMKSYVKEFLNGVKLIEVVPGIVRSQERLRSTYSATDHDCRYSKHELKTVLYKLEEDASKIYTDKVFFAVRKEIERVGGLNTEPFVQSDGFKTYSMCKHNRLDQRFDVVCSQGEGGTQFVCSCQKMAYEGIPCCHTINVLKLEGIAKIPNSLVMKRWTVVEKVDAGKFDIRKLRSFNEDGGSKSRFGYISDRFSKLSFRASLSNEVYDMVNEELDKLEKKIEAAYVVPEVRRQEDERGRHYSLIRDPDVVKLKRKKKEPKTTTGKQGRKCSKCGGYGHNKQRCGKKSKNQSSSPHVDTTSMTSDSSEDETDGEGRGESSIPQANETGPSTTIPHQQPVQQFPFLPRYQGFPGMHNFLAGARINGMQNENDGAGRGESNIPQANEAGPSTTIPHQQQVYQFPFPPGYQGFSEMQNLLTDLHINGMKTLTGAYPQMYGPLGL